MYEQIWQVKQAHIESGGHFFDEKAVRFFHSRIGESVYHGRYFITSETQPDNRQRYYTVRAITDDGDIENVSEFMYYRTWQAARNAVDRFASQESEQERE